MAHASAMVSSSAPSVYSVQALVLLAEVGCWGVILIFFFFCLVCVFFFGLTSHLAVQILAPLLDMVYRSDEKEKAVPLISRIMYYVFPYLKNHR